MILVSEPSSKSYLDSINIYYDDRAYVIYTCDNFISQLNGDEIYLTPSLPDTHLQQVDGEVGEYKIQGIQIDNFMPMRTWKIRYNGQMK